MALSPRRLVLMNLFFVAGHKKHFWPTGHKNTLLRHGFWPSLGSRIAKDLVFVSAHFRPQNVPKHYEFKAFW